MSFSLLVLMLNKNFVKKFQDWAINGGGTIFPLSLRLRGIKLSLV
jgi:hypothetical protein